MSETQVTKWLIFMVFAAAFPPMRADCFFFADPHADRKRLFLLNLRGSGRRNQMVNVGSSRFWPRNNRRAAAPTGPENRPRKAAINMFTSWNQSPILRLTDHVPGVIMPHLKRIKFVESLIFLVNFELSALRPRENASLCHSSDKIAQLCGATLFLDA